MSRTTNDPKGTVIRVRVTREEIEWLYRERVESGRTMSEILREIIDNAIKSS